MTTYEIGQTVTFGLTVKDAAGALADTGVMPTCTVTLPDGTTAAATVTKTSTGTYSATLASTQAGRHRATWTASGANSGGFPYTDIADVWPADPRLVIGLSDARAELNTLDADTANDDELRLYIATATEMLIDLCTPLGIAVLPEVRVEDHTPGGALLVLGRRPVTLPTTVIEYVGTSSSTIAHSATPNAAGDSYTYEASTGILTRRVGGMPARWQGTVQVTYTWGSSIISPRVVTTARALVAHLWSIQNRGARPSFGGDTIVTSSGYAIPNRVVEMLNPTGASTPAIA